MSQTSSDEELPVYYLGGGSYKPHPPECTQDVIVSRTDETSDKQWRAERNKAATMDKKKQSETAKLQREHDKTSRQHHKEIESALKRATSASRRDDQPAERLKHMCVILGSALDPDLLTVLVTKLSEVGIEHSVRKDGSYHPGTVYWCRRRTERTVNEQAEILTKEFNEEQNEILVVIEASAFAGLVHYAKLVQSGQSLSDGEKTFQQFVAELVASIPDKRLTLVVQGLTAFLRGNKTHQNRQYRQAVTGKPPTGHAPSQRLFTTVTRLDCEEVLVGVQLTLGPVVRVCETTNELADYILCMTKAISESHYRQSNPFSFHAECGQGPSREALSKAASKVSVIFKHQLMQFNNVSEHMAAAVVNHYPSPAHLLNAYDSCEDIKSAQLLLQDIEVRRGVGVVSSTRRLGPTHSRRIHRLLTSTDKTLMLD